jgi:putative oxidoreductase
MESCTTFCFSPLLIGKLGGAAFFGILFMQSGYDKLSDWKGNITWIKSYFEKTSFSKFAFLLLSMLTILEVSAGIFSLAGIITTFTCQCPTYLYFALILTGISLLSLFLGMRMAKDYSSAAALAAYFAVWTGWVILFNL